MKNEEKDSEPQEILEGNAKIKTGGHVFYNPVQEFNRDLSISVISTFAKNFRRESIEKSNKTSQTLSLTTSWEPGEKYEDGLYILEALSATGLRSIRYAKEIPGVKEVVANDISSKAVDDIKNNVKFNNIEHLVTPSHCDAVMLMYQHKRQNQFDVIDLDPYGCPSIFLDSAVQAIKDGGLLLITATDMAVLAGNAPETCYTKYGAISLRTKNCHEMALRILLQCIESHANRYSKYIVPLLSLSADFYIRVFVRVYSGAYKCKFSTSKLAQVYQCTGCDSFTLQPLGIIKSNEAHVNQVKFKIPTGPPVGPKCEHCEHTHHMGGPIWSAPLHSQDFVEEVLKTASEKLGTFRRIQGVLSVITEELNDVPLYYTLEKLCNIIHVENPQMLAVRFFAMLLHPAFQLLSPICNRKLIKVVRLFDRHLEHGPLHSDLFLRSAILNAGYRVSFTHVSRTSIKTDAPTKVVWDIMRCWEKSHPASKKRLTEGSPASAILSKNPEKEYSFAIHPQANPPSRKLGFVRFQENPLPHWGPGCRNTAMVGDQKIEKSKKNQGKRKRECSVETATEVKK